MTLNVFNSTYYRAVPDDSAQVHCYLEKLYFLYNIEVVKHGASGQIHVVYNDGSDILSRVNVKDIVRFIID